MSQYYSTGTICRLFENIGRPISKMTLVRLETLKVINPPPRRGGGNRQRMYTEENLNQIKAYWLGEPEVRA